VYVGGVGEFGFLKPDSVGKMQYVSLFENLKSENHCCPIKLGISKKLYLSV
jgi:hypothetical protein